MLSDFLNRHSAHEEAALSNPNTTREGRKRAKMELKLMVPMTAA
jgi:hypothetical protein